MKTLVALVIGLAVALSSASGAEQRAPSSQQPPGPRQVPKINPATVPGAIAVNPVELTCAPYTANADGNRVYRVTNETPWYVVRGFTIYAESTTDPGDRRRASHTLTEPLAPTSDHYAVDPSTVAIPASGPPTGSGQCRAWFYAGYPDLETQRTGSGLCLLHECSEPLRATYRIHNHGWVRVGQTILAYSLWKNCDGTWQKVTDGTTPVPPIEPHRCCGCANPTMASPACPPEFLFEIPGTPGDFAHCDLRLRLTADATQLIREPNEANNTVEATAGGFCW